jgi:MraZ protein
MLTGSYLAVLSDARRVAVPKKFIIDLGNYPVVAKWYEDCLVLVKAEFLNNLVSRLTGERRVIDLGVRDVERFIIGSAFEVEADEQGRIIIPEILSIYANLTKDLVFVGLMDRVEIWSKEIWDEKSKSLAKTTKEYIEKLGQ